MTPSTLPCIGHGSCAVARIVTSTRQPPGASLTVVVPLVTNLLAPGNCAEAGEAHGMEAGGTRSCGGRYGRALGGERRQRAWLPRGTHTHKRPYLPRSGSGVEPRRGSGGSGVEPEPSTMPRMAEGAPLIWPREPFARLREHRLGQHVHGVTP
eukprot:364398-Chlamydomonas_euryale.AAC.12